ncbi:MAG: endo-1,4-beta-xylanase, partial [Opitutales bacterium]|nr:endo-1,4-beta-xylanase [Opitutales bacterium]
MKKLLITLFCGVVATSVFSAPKPETPISDKLRELWSDPVLQEKIKIGIEHNRKGDFYLHFVNKKNWKVKVEDLKVEMVSHDFLFGAQIFLLNGFKTEQENRQYEKEFLNLFNFATVPFYWKNYERENGKYAFGKDCEHDYRRPSQDAVVEFCNANGLKMKGHTFSWYINQLFLPAWVERDEKIIDKYLNRYMGKIAERYSEDITIWDVSNESSDTRRWLNNAFPFDHTFKAFKEAERILPYSNELIVNHTTPVWWRVSKYEEHSQDYLSTLSLISRGPKVDFVGLQLHLFKKEDRDDL